MTKHKLPTAANLATLFGGDKTYKGSEFTVESLVTHKDYTFKLKRSEFQGKMYIHVYVEQGYLQFSRLGTYLGGQIKNKGQVVATPAAQAIGWLLRQLEAKNYSKLDSSVAVYHFGSCIKCGKTLTDAVSIQNGIGPVCNNLN